MQNAFPPNEPKTVQPSSILSTDVGTDLEAFEKLRETIESPEMRRLVKQFQRFIQAIQQVDVQKLEAIQRALTAAVDTKLKADLLGNLGWTFPAFMSPFRLHKILQLSTPEQIDSAFVEFYQESDEKAYTLLRDSLIVSESLKHWRPLLKQCCDAYQRHDYLIAVPSLLTVLEGAIAKPENVKFVRGTDRANFFSKKIDASVAESVEQYMWRSANAFVKTLFEHHGFEGPEPANLNRHWILHGRDMPDWGQADCLRLLQGIAMFTRLK